MAGITDSIHGRLGELASKDLGEFRQFLRRLRKSFPQQAAEGCLLYVAAHGLDPAAESMVYWLTGDNVYIHVLLDPEALPPDLAAKAIAVVKEIDRQFLSKFVKALSELKSPAEITRALGLLPALGDYSILIPWLRGLNQSTDDRVRARSAKLLCELRPNKGLIERQLASEDPRVRANSLEALWRNRTEDARKLLLTAAADPNHRVAGNAMLGLYLQGEPGVLNRMIEGCAHKNHLYRSAMAWALGETKDVLAIPALRELTRDGSLVVRKRALKSLLAIEAANPNRDQAEKTTTEAIPGALVPEAPPEAVETSSDPEFNVFMFR